MWLGGDIMELYQQLYYLLFHAATDAIRALEKNNSLQAKSILIFAQKQAEAIYLDHEEDE